MARVARVICPELPHHVSQRGNRRQETFFCDDDYLAYISFMAEWCKKRDVSIWAWCLMPNHVHLVAVPQTETGLARAIGEAHRRYTRMINFREKWRGHLWQERFASFPMDERHLYSAVRIADMKKLQDTYDQAIDVFLTMARTQFFYDVNKRIARFMMNGHLLKSCFPTINLLASRQLEFNNLMIVF